MAALLVAMSVMAIGLSVALPAWSHMIRREKEEELIFRGNQYARAINMYQRKYANANPQNLDALIKERFLRRKFKDPLSPEKDGEFQMLYPQAGPARGTGNSPVAGIGAGRSTGAGRSSSASTGTGAVASGAAASAFGTKPSAGIGGVTSKNTGQSLRVLNGKTHYNEWEFLGIEYVRAGGGASGATGQPGAPQPGGIGGNRGGPNSGTRGAGPSGASGSGSGFGSGFGRGSQGTPMRGAGGIK